MSHEHDNDITPVGMEVEDDKKKGEHGHGHSHDHSHGEAVKIVGIGAVTVGGATFIIDREGRIAWRHLPDNWRIRPRPTELLDELARIP